MSTDSRWLAEAERKADHSEIERLLEQSRLGDAAIEELTKEREMYRMRWLGSMTPEDAALIRAENERLRAALKPFADIARELVEVLPETAKNNMMWAVPKVADFREALRAYEQSAAPKGPAGDAGQVGWMGGEHDR